jgi:hypothetical protein
MPRIPSNLPQVNQRPDVLTEVITPEQATRGLRQEQGLIENFSNQVMGEVVSSRAQERAALINANDAQFRADLAQQKATSHFFSAAGQYLNDVQATELNIMKIDMAEEANRIEKEDRAYLTTAPIALQESLITNSEKIREQSRQQGVPYSKAMLEFFTAQQADLLAKAPSDNSKLNMLEKSSRIKLNLLEDAYRTEAREREASANQANTAAFDSLVRQTQSSPVDLETFKAQGDTLLSEMEKAGTLSPEETASMRVNLKSELTAKALETKVMDSPEEVINAVVTTEHKNLTPDNLNVLMQRATLGMRESATSKKKMLDQAINRNIASSGVPLDPRNKDHQEGVDLLFQDFMGKYTNPETGLIDVDSERFVGGTFAFLKGHNNIMPSSLNTMINANVINGNPEQQARYARLVTEMSSDPSMRSMAGSLSKEVTEKALRLDSAIQGGLSPADAVAAVDKQVNNVRSDIVQLRKTKLRQVDDYKIDNSQKYIQDQFGAVNDEVLADYRAQFEESYTQTGDVEISKRLATNQVSKFYGRTRVNGQREVMKFAPSVLYPGAEKEFEADLQASIGALNGDGAATNKLRLADGEYDAVIKSDVRTGKDRSYALMYKKPIGGGVFVDAPVINPETGKPRRYRFEAERMPNYETLNTKVEEARQNRQMWNNNMRDYLGKVSGEWDKLDTVDPVTRARVAEDLRRLGYELTE